jgi:hypothetical protein
MRISYPAEDRLTVESRLEVEYLQSPERKGEMLASASRQDGVTMFADYPDAFVKFLKARGIQVTLLDKKPLSAA